MGSGLRKSKTNSHYSTSLANKSNNNLRRLATSASLSTKESLGAFMELNCKKIREPEQNLSIISKDLDLAGTKFFLHSTKYTSEYKFIQETQLEYFKLLEDFKSKVHEVCITGFQIHDGLFLLLVSLCANKSIKIKFLRSSPYFKTSPPSNPETKSLLQAWSSLFTFLDSISTNDYQKLKKSQSRLEDFQSLLHQYPSSSYSESISESIFLIQCSLLITSSLIKQFKKLNKKISRFFENFSQKEIEIRRFGLKANQLNCYSAERILHHVLNNKLN